MGTQKGTNRFENSSEMDGTLQQCKAWPEDSQGADAANQLKQLLL